MALFPGSAAEGENRDVHSREFQLSVSHVTERLSGMQLACTGALQDRHEPLRGLIDDLGDLENLLRASHDHH